MPDAIDFAQEYEQNLREDALKEQARRVGAVITDARKSRRYCVECGDPIPQPRRNALPGVETCVSCQEDLEKQKKVR
jgi:phage/conjugal plasmid C-4 type zinc finger TraR family protein